MFFIESGFTIASQIIGKKRNATLGPADVDMVVTGDVVSQTMHVYHDCFGRHSGPSPSVELVFVISWKPSFDIGRGCHCYDDCGSEARLCST